VKSPRIRSDAGAIWAFLESLSASSGPRHRARKRASPPQHHAEELERVDQTVAVMNHRAKLWLPTGMLTTTYQKRVISTNPGS
jgi:hypothetical protein